ncbi:hypothetical protein LINPERPRIM_LOCUS36995 [Linum perenne]
MYTTTTDDGDGDDDEVSMSRMFMSGLSGLSIDSCFDADAENDEPPGRIRIST